MLQLQLQNCQLQLTLTESLWHLEHHWRYFWRRIWRHICGHTYMEANEGAPIWMHNVHNVHCTCSTIGGSYCKGNESCPSANCKGNCCPHASWCHLQRECKCPNADCKCSFSGGLDGGLDDESCTVSRSLPSSPIISTLFTLSRLKSARLVQSGLSASTPNPWHCNGPLSTLQFVTQMYFCILYFLYSPSLSEVSRVI